MDINRDMDVASSQYNFTPTAFSPIITNELSHIRALLQQDFSADQCYQQLYQWLGTAKDFRRFKNLVTEYLQSIGFSDWAYVRMEIPNETCSDELIGTGDPEFRRVYIEEEFYKYDVFLQHGSKSEMPVYHQSLTPLMSLGFLQADVLQSNCSQMALSRRLGYHDILLVPFNSGVNGQVAVTFTAKHVSSADFQRRVAENVNQLAMLTRLIDWVGSRFYPDVFVARKNAYQKIAQSHWMRYLKVMHEYDVKREQAAEIMCKSVSSVEKYASKAREFFGVKTDHHAIKCAIRQGFIEF